MPITDEQRARLGSCPNCGALTLGKDCELCGPAELYEKEKEGDRR